MNNAEHNSLNVTARTWKMLGLFDADFFNEIGDKRHGSLAEVQRYCGAANRKRLGGEAMKRIGSAEPGTANGKPT